MDLWQIDQAVNGLCEDVRKIVKFSTWKNMTEKQLIHELVVYILGSGVRYELAISYANAIKMSKTLKKENIESLENSHHRLYSILNNEVFDDIENRTFKRFRYPARAANFISKSIFNIHAEFNSMTELLNRRLDPVEMRRVLIKLCPGIGPKQASHFLKNVGFSDKLAVLDRHILKYMELAEKKEIPARGVARITLYEELEKNFINLAKKFKYSVSIVDQAMWFIMRTLSKEGAT